jgi:L-alanine-DL-glutamate epimerase-like enolase superfamily enzyme
VTTIRDIEAIPLRIGFRETFRFGTIDRKQSQNVVLVITTSDGVVGYGEACPVPAFTAETQESIVALVEQRVKPLLVGEDPLRHRPLVRRLERVLFGCPFTLTAIDIALWDLAGKLLSLPISTLLGGRFRERIEMHGSVGWDDPAAMVDTAHAQRALGYGALKLYAGRGTVGGDLGRIEAVREAVGPDVGLLLDVNGQWSVSQCLNALPRLAELGVVLLEQPLAASDELGQAEVVRASGVDICADESIYTAADVARIGRQRTARVINLGLSKLGGLLRAGECETVARSVGLGITVGSVLELGIASTAGLHLAAAVQDLTYPSYLIGPLKYERQITSPELRVEDGEVAVPTGPGLGVEVDVDLLAALDLRR